MIQHNRQTKRHFSPEFKLEAIEQVVKYHQRPVEVARALDIDASMLRKWIRRYEAEMQGISLTGGAAITPEHRRIQALEKQVRQLEMEKAILKQAAVLMSERGIKSVR